MTVDEQAIPELVTTWMEATADGRGHPLERGGTRFAGPAPACPVLRKTQSGRWVIFRDANMLAPLK
jgi:ketosteroid isomerase-like protein